MRASMTEPALTSLVQLWGRHFSNPVGLAAGFDKHGEAIDGLFNLGFGYVEIGSITPRPQDGNPQPRLFRLPSTQSVINRYGFNSEGSIAVLARLRDRIHTYITQNALMFPPTAFPEAKISANPDPDPVEAILQNRTDAEVIDTINVPRSLHAGKVLGINLGKNKLSAADSVADFVDGVRTLGPYADLLVVNVSSPNTPGLRSLQRREIVEDLLKEVVKARDQLQIQKKPMVLLKIAPDLSRQEVGDIGEAAKSSKIDGIIVSNTTISRPVSAGKDPALQESGGLSGPPVKPLSLRTLKTLYALTGGEIPLVGCGGISTGEDAIEYAKAGASFIQLYTALGYQGVGLPRMIKDEIATYLRSERKTWRDIVGSGIDLDGIRALGGERNTSSLLSLEEEATDSFETLRSAIENALAGKMPSRKPLPLTREEQLAAFLPDWSDNLSPAISAQATTPVATVQASGAAESGSTPDGCPQIVILDRVPQYRPAQAISKQELKGKVQDAKRYAEEVKHRLESGAEDLRKGAGIVGAAFREAGHELKGDLRSLEEISKDATRQAGHAFGQVGREIKEEWHAVETVAKGRASLAGQAFSEFGREVREESKAAAQAGSRAAGEAKEEISHVAHELGNDLQHDKKLVRDWGKQAAALGKDAERQSRDVSAQFGRDLQHEIYDATRVAGDAVQQSGRTLSQLGRDVRAESSDAVHHGRELVTNETGTLRRDSQDAAQALAEGAKLDAEAIKEAGHDMKQESAALGDIAKDAFRQAGQAFRELGHEIRHDPLLNKAEQGVRTAERPDVQGPEATSGVRADASSQRKGLSSLFSTFGERRNVTEDSKRLV